MLKLKFILPLIAIVLAVTAIIGFSSFSSGKESKEQPPTEYYWYEVDYSVPGGRIPSGASPLFSGVKKTKTYAQSNDGCDDIDELDCLRGFVNMPSLPTTSFDETTPKPDDSK